MTLALTVSNDVHCTAQAEADERSEQLAGLQAAHESAQQRAASVQAALTQAERRLVNSDAHIADLEHELNAAAQREDHAHQNLVAMQQDYEKLQVLSFYLFICFFPY